ncbi:MAG: hypothetical protein H7Z43_05395 [Clostridia bacterium]|nr:hypothetical protein [Deltaproteobacteria bacterium]
MVVLNGWNTGLRYASGAGNTTHALIVEVDPAYLVGGAEIEVDGHAAPFTGQTQVSFGLGPLQRGGHISIRLASPSAERMNQIAQSLQISVRVN